MATIKSFTDLEQSRKLAKILPRESADMRYQASYDNKNYLKYIPRFVSTIIPLRADIPCWSLAALFSVLPKSLMYTPNPALDGYCCKNIMHDLETYGSSPIDACYEMILKLNELNLL